MPKGVIRKDKHKLIARIRAGKKIDFAPSSTVTHYRKRLGMKYEREIHPNADKIIEALKANEKHIWIQSEYKCSRSTVKRYKLKLTNIHAPIS
jgi:DNA invertase Pin-like site-specific DNA recombinase